MNHFHSAGPRARRCIGLRLAALLVGSVLVAASGLVLRTAPAVGRPGAQALDLCRAVPAIDAHPRTVLLGETVAVTLSARMVCPGEPGPLHVVLVLDGSASMAGANNEEMRRAAWRFVTGLRMGEQDEIRIGVVRFNSAAKVLCELSDDAPIVRGCIERVGAAGGTNIGEGIHAGTRVLLKGRQDVADPEEIREVLVVLTDGEDNQGCSNATTAAGKPRSQGVLLVAGCMGTSCDARCMRQIASSEEHFIEGKDIRHLSQAMERMALTIPRTPAVAATISVTSSKAFERIADSYRPRLTVPLGLGDPLRWTFERATYDGVTVTYRLRSRVPGLQPLGDHRLELSRIVGWPPEQVRHFDPLHVRVLEPRSVPTATSSGPAPSVTASAAASHTPNAPPIPTATAAQTEAPSVGVVHLPLMLGSARLR